MYRSINTTFIKIIILVLFAFTLASGCSKEKKDETSKRVMYGFDNIVSDKLIDILTEGLDNCSCTPTIIKAKYENQIVYYVIYTDAYCHVIIAPTLYDSQGNIVAKMNDVYEYSEKVSETEIIYRCGH
ncbi:MAG: hypothetical protein CVU00_14865 [Bacteroidetes bacterium HGW-Bacteroidetes-17]|jgi:hypothetical protein|nr:MAG: hypothetical protein CVU00_14865 [Bacteroidetes bacterium HGW-Bacteroidetes-17]